MLVAGHHLMTPEILALLGLDRVTQIKRITLDIAVNEAPTLVIEKYVDREVVNGFLRMLPQGCFENPIIVELPPGTE